MRRGELYLVERTAKNDTKKQRVYVVVSRQPLIDSAYSTVICAPVYTTSEGIATQVSVGEECGLKHSSCIRCEAKLDESSNSNEAYLKTRGWSPYINIWYLYFRKVNFPVDPDIHGRWEWAGIYYGEKL